MQGREHSGVYFGVLGGLVHHGGRALERIEVVYSDMSVVCRL